MKSPAYLFFKNLRSILPLRYKLSFIKLIILTLLTTFTEIGLLAVIYKVISSVISGDGKISFIHNRLDHLAFDLFVIGIVCLILRIYLTYSLGNTTNKIGIYLNNLALHGFLLRSFDDKLNTHSSDIISALLLKSEKLTGGIIYPFCQIIVNIIIVLGSLIYSLTNINFQIQVGIILILLSYITAYFIVKNKYIKYGLIISQCLNDSHKTLNNTISSIREIFILKNTDSFIKANRIIEEKHRSTMLISHVISTIPRYVLESFLIFTIAFLIYNNSEDGNNGLELKNNFSNYGFFILVIFRILPYINQIYVGFTTIQVSLKSGDDLIEFMREEIEIEFPLKSDEEKSVIDSANLLTIEFSCVDYVFPNSKNIIINNFSYYFKSGQSYLIEGKSGSGKSTLIDILLGLRLPTNGKVICKYNNQLTFSIENFVWHVPQKLFLRNDNILDVITVDSKLPINFEKLKHVCDIMELEDCFNSIDYLDVKLGEDGNLISGGQRQRLATARALYMDRPILIMDESLNALDIELQIRIMNKIINLYQNRMLIVISHQYEIKELFNNKILINSSHKIT